MILIAAICLSVKQGGEDTPLEEQMEREWSKGGEPIQLSSGEE
jgi:hypothetical protein